MRIEPYIRRSQYYETDQMGIIHHANYIYWMEEARVDFLEKIGFGYEKAVECGIDFAVLGVTGKYKSMCHFREDIRIKMTVTKLAPMRMTVSYEMTGVSDGVLRFVGESEHCFYSSAKQRPIALNKELPKLYELFLSQMEEQD